MLERPPYPHCRAVGCRYGAALAVRKGRTLDVADLDWLGNSIEDALAKAACRSGFDQRAVMTRTVEEWVDVFCVPGKG